MVATFVVFREKFRRTREIQIKTQKRPKVKNKAF
jgi:hypothetical protein